MNVVAVDPGKMTGVSVFTNGEFRSFELSRGFGGFAVWLDSESGLFRPHDHLIIESFTVNAGTAKKDSGAYPEVFSIIGAARLTAYQNGMRFGFQTPAEAKSFATNDKLKKLGWFSGGLGHADDSARHLLTFLAKNNYRPILERLTAP